MPTAFCRIALYSCACVFIDNNMYVEDVYIHNKTASLLSTIVLFPACMVHCVGICIHQKHIYHLVWGTYLLSSALSVHIICVCTKVLLLFKLLYIISTAISLQVHTISAQVFKATPNVYTCNLFSSDCQCTVPISVNNMLKTLNITVAAVMYLCLSCLHGCTKCCIQYIVMAVAIICRLTYCSQICSSIQVADNCIQLQQQACWIHS